MTRFAIEAHYDHMWILRLDSTGFQDVLYKWSGSFDQVMHQLLATQRTSNSTI